MNTQDLPAFEETKEIIIITTQEYYTMPVSYLNQYFRDGWSLNEDKQNNVVIFYRCL